MFGGVNCPSTSLVTLPSGVIGGGGADCLPLEPPPTIVSMNVFFKSTKSLLKELYNPVKCILSVCFSNTFNYSLSTTRPLPIGKEPISQDKQQTTDLHD
jgi:hypothetical protein